MIATEARDAPPKAHMNESGSSEENRLNAAQTTITAGVRMAVIRTSETRSKRATIRAGTNRAATARTTYVTRTTTEMITAHRPNRNGHAATVSVWKGSDMVARSTAQSQTNIVNGAVIS